MIHVNWEVNVIEGSHTFSFEDLNTTQEKWDDMCDVDREELIQEALDELPEEVCMVVDTWDEQ